MREEVANWFMDLQQGICNQFEKADNQLHFIKDEWNREGGGGGITRVFSNGDIFERGGVNFSSVFGPAPEYLFKLFPEIVGTEIFFYATGVSIVIHPKNPNVPIIHMNVRYFEMGNTS